MMTTRPFYILVVFFTMFLHSVSHAQQKNSNNVSTYLNINGTTEQYSNAVDQLFKMLKSQHSSAPENFWKSLESDKKTAVNNMKHRLAPAYESYFTTSELNEMIVFYKTAAGKQVAKDRTKLTEQQFKEVNAFYKTVTGEKVIAQGEALRKTIGEISEDWSRDLYRTIVDKLQAAGY